MLARGEAFAERFEVGPLAGLVAFRAAEHAAGCGDGTFDHQIIGEAEILDQQAISVGGAGAGGVGEGAGAVREGRGCVAPAVNWAAEGAHEAEFEHGADIGGGAAEGCEIGDEGVAGGDVRLVAPRDAVGFGECCPFGGLVGQRVERGDAGEEVFATDGFQQGGTGLRVGQEHVRAGEIDAHFEGGLLLLARDDRRAARAGEAVGLP